MATITPTVKKISKHRVTISYGTMTEADTGAGVDLSGYGAVKALSLHESGGDFTTGGVIALEGSLGGVGYTAIKDLAGAAITLTADGEKVSNEVYPYVRADVTAGTGISVTPTIEAHLG